VAYISLYGVRGRVCEPVNPGDNVIVVDPALAGVIAFRILAGDSTFFSISTATLSELVKVNGTLGGNMLVVERAQALTQALSFPIGATLAFEVTSEAILGNMGAIPAIGITGTGAAEVTNPTINQWGVFVPVVTIAPAVNSPIEVLGTFPNFQLALQARDGCGGTAGDTVPAITNVEASGIATGYASGDTAYINVLPPNFVGSGVTITGTWPNITFSVAGLAGGTVTSVGAGAGLSISGVPAVNPTLSITNTGVVAGTYGGIQINSRGQIVAVPATLNPVSVVNGNAPLSIVRAGDAITLSVAAATVAAPGVVELADPADVWNPADNTRAATPAVVQQGIDLLVLPSASGAESFTGEPDASYTNAISATATPIVLAAGEKAIVMAHATALDGTAPLTPVNYGMAVFNAAPARVRSNRAIPQCSQQLSFLVQGPVNTVFTLVTTAIPGSASVVSFGLNIIKF
jgi:hypothetical protein